MKLSLEGWKDFLIKKKLLKCTSISYNEMKLAWDDFTKSEEPGIPVEFVTAAANVGIKLK